MPIFGALVTLPLHRPTVSFPRVGDGGVGSAVSHLPFPMHRPNLSDVTVQVLEVNANETRLRF